MASIMHFNFVLSDKVKEANKLDVNLNEIFTAIQIKADEDFVKVTWGEGNSAIYYKESVEQFVKEGHWKVLH